MIITMSLFTKQEEQDFRKIQPPKEKSMDKQSGMTLTEVLVSVVILALILTALLSMLDMGYRVERSSSDETTATFLAQTKIEEAKQKLLSGESATQSLTALEPPYENFSFQVSVQADPGNTRRITVRVFKDDKQEAILITRIGER
jgi:prepilin-type N-terminal cleavage/methylation domain-containing protein